MDHERLTSCVVADHPVPTRQVCVDVRQRVLPAQVHLDHPLGGQERRRQPEHQVAHYRGQQGIDDRLWVG